METILYLLDLCVLVALIFGLLFAAQGVREKSDKALRRQHMRRSGIVLAIYLALNLIRLYLEGGLF